MVAIHLLKTPKQDKLYAYLPAFVRKQMGIKPNSKLDLIIDGKKIIITVLPEEKGE
jgi:AbrB family looped-hinge helix DNA binding protein